MSLARTMVWIGVVFIATAVAQASVFLLTGWTGRSTWPLITGYWCGVIVGRSFQPSATHTEAKP